MEHDVKIYRTWETPRSIISDVFVDGDWLVYGLEPPRVNVVQPEHPCIPAGRYRVIWTYSPHLGYVTPEVLEVPGRTAIRWHVGNGPRDVIGCMAVGMTRNPDSLLYSKIAFDLVQQRLKDDNEIWATYIDGPRQPELINNGESPEGQTAVAGKPDAVRNGDPQPGKLSDRHQVVYA